MLIIYTLLFQHHYNVKGSRFEITSRKKHVGEDDILFTNRLAGKWEIPSLALMSAYYLGGN